MRELKKNDLQRIIPDHAAYIGQLMDNGYRAFYSRNGPDTPFTDRPEVWSVYELIGIEDVSGRLVRRYSRIATGVGEPIKHSDLEHYEWKMRRIPSAPRHIPRAHRIDGSRIRE